MNKYKLTIKVTEFITIEANSEKEALALFESDDFSSERRVITDLYYDGRVDSIKQVEE